MIAFAAHRPPPSQLAVAPRSTALPVALAGHLASVALDYIETAVFVLDCDARIQFASAAARRLLDTHRLCSRNGVLSSSIGSEGMTLRRIVRACVDATSGPSEMAFHRLDEADDALCLALVAAPRLGSGVADKPLVMAFAVSACMSPQPNCRQLRMHFGLTDAQAKLAVEIAKGDGLKACARRLGIAMSTGRSHLRQIFEKTETKRQAELVRLISSCRFRVPGSEKVE
ncbi:helix-turn-helix transcriptional regulator [Bradyrhizobium sp. LHD-71]|uniref:helix-turn-helix transcriptional regulator n=1 Tax=Bradyrhizobium sp. LHD-71 TaxID=3072141 RepID=UPI00280D5F82|nr:helix-turn-helix transcriptional regulator [Bradyrhizobium sp. LHD-71]MDQ8732846.1 helix-turn-helix transcriptional regulator [Bradyrhizobium sp. LHD-71]